MLAQLQGLAVQFVYSEADLVSHPTAPCCQIYLKTRRSLASLARSPNLGLSPMLQRLSSMWREISHETVDAVRRCAP